MRRWRPMCGPYGMALLAAYRGLNTRQQGALLEVARGMASAAHPQARKTANR